MNTLKKQMLAAVVAMVGLCGTAWAEVMSAGDYQFDTETWTITGYTGMGGDIVIPESFPASWGSLPVMAIGDNAFCGNEKLTSVTIPMSVTNIGQQAFYQCKVLTSVTFPEHSQLVSIGLSAFKETGLTSVTFPSDLKTIGDSAFEACSGLADVAIPEGGSLECIGNCAFQGTSLTGVILSFNVTNIGDRAFCDCSQLASVYLPYCLENIGDCAFSGCTALGTLEIPRDVSKIGVRAFEGCSSLATVTFAPDSHLKTLTSNAFKDCAALANVTIPSEVTEVGMSAFANCSNLSRVGFAPGSQLETIDQGGFCNCFALKSVTLPASVTNIGGQAFSMCTNLTVMTIPAGVKSVGMAAFACCSNLTEVAVRATTPPEAGAMLFAADGTGVPLESLTAIRVPVGTVPAYKQRWSAYESLITDGVVAMPVAYQDWDATGTQLTNATCLTCQTISPTMETLESGWYVVQGQLVIDRSGGELPGLKVNGDVHLILADGAELVVTGATDCAGIEVGVVGSTTNSLTIYGQEGQTGKLTAICGSLSAGVGGGCEDACGFVTINGGIVTATGGHDAAGIGSGCYAGGGVITINVGTVTANGGEGGAGIGSGGSEPKGDHVADGTVVTINGGTVTATGMMGAGIGGGMHAGTGTVTINGGAVTATGLAGSGIGSGSAMSKGWTVTINGGTVMATGFGGAGIGGGLESGGKIELGAPCAVVVNGGEITAISSLYSTYQGDGIGAGMNVSEGQLDPGTLDLSGYTGTHYIYAGMDETGVEVEEVQAGDFATWHTNCYVQITQTKRPAAEPTSDFDFDPATGTITGYHGAGGDVEIPAEIDGVAVKVIGGGAFNGKETLTAVTIPASVTTIEELAFLNCSSLASVTFEAGSQLKEISSQMFGSCTALTAVTIPASVTNIAAYAFGQCSSLVSVAFESDSQLASIGGNVFYGCPLTGITLPEGLRDIGQMAFVQCTNLTAVTIPAGVTNIGMMAFTMCSKLEEVTVLAIEPPQAGIRLFSATGYASDPIATLTAIKVPAGTADKYINEDTGTGWSTYADLITDGTAPEETEPVEYLVWDETEKRLISHTCTEYTVIESGNEMLTLSTGWYVVDGDVHREGMQLEGELDGWPIYTPAIKISGDVHIILKDGASLLARSGGYQSESITLQVDTESEVACTNSLSIYGQAMGTGRLYVDADQNPAVGCGEGKRFGAFTLHGGSVTAVAYGSVGVGCKSNGGSGGAVKINGGEMMVKDYHQSNPAISENVVFSNSEDFWVLTGTEEEQVRTETDVFLGNSRSYSFVHIVLAPPKGSEENPWKVGAAGQEADVLAFTNGIGQVTVRGNGEPKTYDGDAPWAEVEAEIASIIVPQGRVDEFKAAWPNDAEKITDGTIQNVVYYAWNGEIVTGPFTTNARPVTADMTLLDSGWYVVQGQVSMPDHGLVVDGDVNLILADDACLAVTGGASQAGIEVTVVGTVTNSLSIYGQEKQTGRLEAMGKGEQGACASIGGSIDRPDCGSVRIDGGRISVVASSGAGIGTATARDYDPTKGGVVTINGGSVFVGKNGDEAGAGAGIGGGCACTGGEVTINGGTVVVRALVDEADPGGIWSAGIGTGRLGSGCNVTINGGIVDVDVRDGDEVEFMFGAAIGGSWESSGGTVTINGGTVTARSVFGAAIGDGALGTGGTRVIINGGEVYAESGYCYWGEFGSCGGAGVGGGAASSGADVRINGGTVTAIAHPIKGDGENLIWSSGIGAGYYPDALGGDIGAYTMGTFALGPNTTATILSGMDTNGVVVAEVQAGDYGTMGNPGWCTNCYVHIVAVNNPAPVHPLGSPENPWKVGAEGAEESVLACTNGNGSVFVKGTGTPKTYGEGAEPWVGAQPPIAQIIVPRGRGDDFKAAWPALAGLIKEVPNYLAFTARGFGANIYLMGTGSNEDPLLETAFDAMGPWTPLAINGETSEFIEMQGGQTVYFRRRVSNPAETLNPSGGRWKFNFEGTVEASGNIMSLLDKTCQKTGVGEHAFEGLFSSAEGLTSAPELPATTLAESCYQEMFADCSALTNAPALPANKLAKWCYAGMFTRCASLARAPELSATSLSSIQCCATMFVDAEKLNAVTVGFRTWNDTTDGTGNWLAGVAETGVFTCPVELPVIRNASHIPEGWVVKKRFTLPTGLAMGSYVVSNETSEAVLVEPVGSEPGSEEYEVTVGDTIKIYMLPAEGLAVGGKHPLTLNLTEGVNLKTDLPWAVQPVPYQDWDAVNKVMTNAVCTEKYNLVTPGTKQLMNGWYVVQGCVTNTTGVTIGGDVHLILCDDSELAFEKKDICCVCVATGRSLTIYGQTEGTGKLFASSGSYGAGIGGNEKGSPSAGSITINGGQVTAQGGFGAAGIGGGGNQGAGGTVTINGGRVLAVSLESFAESAVGGGGAGIGGGVTGVGGALTINGGEVTAISYPACETGTDPYYAEGIGAGAMGGDSGTLDLSGYTGKYYIYAGMDVTGVEAEEVQAGDFSTWHTNLYVQITTTPREKPAAEGSPEKPWKVGTNGNGQPAAYTNGNNEVVVTGEGLPKPYGGEGDPAPWAGFDPEIETIYVPQNTEDIYKHQWPDDAEKIVGVPDYLSFTAKDGDVKISFGKTYAEAYGLEYSFDPIADDWTTLPEFDLNGTADDSDKVFVPNGQTLYIRKAGDAVTLGVGRSDQKKGTFKMERVDENGTATVEAGGNVMSLLDKTCRSKEVDSYAFYYLFCDCRILTAAPKLPATKLGVNCYEFMFDSCSALKAAPELPATELESGCYCYMFYGCSALESIELPASELKEACYRFMFQFCSKLSMVKVGFDAWSDLAYVCEDWLLGVAETGTFICSQALENNFAAKGLSYGASTIPEGWRTARDYLSFTAKDGDITLSLEKFENPFDATFEYSFSAGAENWTTYSEPIQITKDQTVYFRKQGAAVEAISRDGGNFWRFVFGGDEGATVAAGGNVMSLLDPTCQSRTIGKSGLVYLFDFMDRLTSAPSIEADHLGENACEGMFRGCANLASGIEIVAEENLDSGAIRSLLGSAAKVDEITVAFKEWAGANFSIAWVDNVAPFGVFHCPSELPIEVDINHIPEGWIVFKKFSILAIEGLKHRVTNSAGEVIAPCAVSQDGTKTYEVLAGDEETYAVHFEDVDGYPVVGEDTLNLGDLSGSVEIGSDEYPLPERGVLLKVEGAPGHSTFTIYCGEDVFAAGPDELTTRVSPYVTTKVVYTTDEGWAYEFADGLPVTEKVQLATEVTDPTEVSAPTVQPDYYQQVWDMADAFDEYLNGKIDDLMSYPTVVQNEGKAMKDTAMAVIDNCMANPLPSSEKLAELQNERDGFDEKYAALEAAALEFVEKLQDAAQRFPAADAELKALGATDHYEAQGAMIIKEAEGEIAEIQMNDNPPTTARIAELEAAMASFEQNFAGLMADAAAFLAARTAAQAGLDELQKDFDGLMNEPAVAAKWAEMQASQDPNVAATIAATDANRMALELNLSGLQTAIDNAQEMKDIDDVSNQMPNAGKSFDALRSSIVNYQIPQYLLRVNVTLPVKVSYSVYAGENAQDVVVENEKQSREFPSFLWESRVKVVYHLVDEWYAFDDAENKYVNDFVALDDMMQGDRQIAEPALGSLKDLVSTYEIAKSQFDAWEKEAEQMPQHLKDQIKAAVDSARAAVEALYAIGVPVGETCNNINQSVNDIRLQVEGLLAQGYVALAFDLSNTLKDKHGQFLDANQGQIGALYQYGTPEANKLLEDLALLQNDVEFFCYQLLGEVKDAKSYADYVARMQELLARMEDLQTRLDESVRVIAALPLVAERNADSGALRVIVRQTLREGEESWRIMWFMRGELDDVISRAADIVGRQVGEVFDSTLFEFIPCKFAEYSSDYELSDIAAPLEEMAACVIVAIDSQGMVTRIGGVDRLDELGRGEVKGADVIGAEPLWVHYYESKDGQLYDRDALAKPIASSPKDQLLLDQGEQSHYVVLGNCDVDSLVVKGNVNLILGRGCHLSVKNGIVIEEGSILRICSEHDFRFEPHLMGQMSVDKSAVVAERPAALCGFQSSQLQIHGGKVDIASATAGVKVGTFDMLNGEVTVTAGAGYAGVDLAYVYSRCLVDAGRMTVTGGAGAAAIGGNVGENGGQFYMNRGLLRANATPTDEGKCAAGIGAGTGAVTHGGFDFQNSELRAFAANSAAEKLNLAPNYAETREPSVLITDGGDLIRALPFTASRQGNEYFLVMNQAPQARYLAVALTKANVFRPYGADSTVGAALWEAVAEIATGARTAVGELTEESFFRLLRERGADSVEKIEIFSPEGCVNIASLEQVILVEFDDRGRVVRMGGVNALSELDGRGTVIDSPIGRTMTGEAAAIVAQDFTLAADSYRLTLTTTSAADNGQAWAWARVGDGELYDGLDDFVNGLLGKTVGEEAFRPLSASELPAIFGDGNWGLFTDNFAQFDRIDPKAASTLRGLVVFKVSVLPVSETGSEMPILAVGGVKNVDQLREGQRLSNQYGEGLERIANQNFTVTRQGDEEQSLLVQPADPLQGGESWHYLALGADEASWRLETINGNLSVYRGATVGDLTVDDLNYLGLSCQIAYEASFAVSGDAEAVYLFKVDGHGRVLTIGLADKLSTLYDPGMSRGDVFGKTFITAQRLGVTRSGDEWTVSVFAAEAQKAEEAGDRLVYFAYADAVDAETAWSKTQGVLSGGMTEVGTVKLAEFPEPAAKGALASDEPFAALPANCTAVFAAWVRGANDVIVTLGGVTEFATIADGETRQAEAGDSRMRPFDFTVSRVEDERRTFWLRSGPRKANEQWTWMAVPSRVMYLLEQEFESSELLLENLRREMFVSKDAGLVKGVQKQKEPAAIQMLRLMLGRGYFGQSTDEQLDVQDIPADTDLLLVMKTDRGTGATCGQGLVIGLEQLPPGGEKRNQVDGRLVYATVDEAGNRTLHETAEPVELVTELTRSIGGNRWYVLGDRGLYEKIRAGDRLTVNGAANVIVPDGSTSDAFKSGRIRLYGGIAVNAGATLNVYGQQLGNGALQVVGADGCAAIGGDEECGAGTINFYGGIVEAESGLGAAAIGGGYLNGGENGAVNLYGGVVIARAFDAAAIGGGQLGSGCDVVLHPAASVICDVEESGLPGIGGCDGMYDGMVQAFGDKRVFIATDTDEELVYRPQDYYLGDVRRGNFLSAELLTVSLPKDARFACKVASATLGGDIGGVLPGDDAYTYKAVRGDTVVVGAEIAGKGVGELYGFRSPNVLKFNCVQDDVTVTADDFKVAMRRAVAPLDYTVSRDFNGELYLTSGETFGANEQLVWMAVPEVMEPTANIPATAQLFNDPIGLMHDLIMTGAQVGDEFCDTFALMLGAKNWGLEFNYDGRPVALPADARHVLAFKVYDGGKFALQAGGSHKKEEKPSLKANKSDAAGTRRMPIIKVGAVADVMYVTPDAPQPNQVVVESVIARQPFSLTRNEDGTFRLSLNGTLQDWIGERWGFATVSAEVWDLVKAGGIEDLTADMMTDLLDSQIGRPFGFFTLDDLGGYQDIFAQFETSGEHVFTCNADTAVVLAFKVRESGDKGADVCTLGYTVDNLQAMAPGGDERKTDMIDGTTDAPACFVTVVNMPAGVTAHLDYVYNDAWFSCAPDAEGEGTAEFSVPEGAKVELRFEPPHGMTFRSKSDVTIECLRQDEIVDASFLVVAPRDLIVPQDLAVNRNSDGTFNLMLPNEQLDLSAGERWLYVALNELDSATCMEGEAAPFGVLLWSMGGMALGQAVGDIVANEFAFAMRNGYSGFVTDGNVTLPKDTVMVIAARCFSFTDSDGTDQTCLVTVGGRNNLQSLGESEMGDNEIEDSETLEEYSLVHYLEWDKSARAFVGGQAHARRLDAAGGVIGNGQWYVNSPDDAKHSSETLTVQGTANLVIRDMTALQLRRIVVGEGATLNVYGQSMREGMLMIKDNSMSGAAFGADGVCGTINLHGVQAMVQGTAVGIGGMVEGGELNVLGANLQVSSKGPAIAGCALNVYGGRVLAASMSGGAYPAINDGISLKSTKLSIFSGSGSLTELEPTTVAAYTAERKPVAKIAEHVNVIVPQVEHVNVTATSIDIEGADVSVVEPEELPGTGCVRYRFERFDNVKLGFAADTGYQLRSPDGYVFFSIDGDRRLAADAVVVTAVSQPPEMIGCQPFTAYRTTDENGQPCCEVKPIGELGPGEQWLWMSCDKALAQTKGTVDDDLTTEEALVEMLDGVVGNVPVGYVSVDMFRAMLPLDRSGVGGADAVIRLPADTDMVCLGKVYDTGLGEMGQRYSNITVGLATNLFERLEGGDAGHNDLGEEPTDDEIEAILKDAFPEPHEVTKNEDGSFRITLMEDMTGPVKIPDNLGAITLDMNGFTITGVNGVNGADGGNALVIVDSGDVGADTELTITEPNEKYDADGDIVGGNGADGQRPGNGGAAIRVDTKRGVKINVEGTVQVVGGKGGTVLGDEDSHTKPGTPGKGVDPSGTRGDRAPGSDQEGEVGGTFAPWAKATLAAEAPDNLQTLLPDGVTVVGNELWFWKRVGTNGKAVGFDFTTLDRAWIKDGEIRFVAGSHFVDQFLYNRAGGLAFVGASSAAVVVKPEPVKPVDPEEKPVKPVLKAGMLGGKDSGLPDLGKHTTLASTGKSIFQSKNAPVVNGPLMGSYSGAPATWRNLAFTMLPGTVIEGNGGAINAADVHALTVADCVFANIIAGELGGAICAAGLDEGGLITNSTFTACSVSDANGLGGAIYATAGMAPVQPGLFGKKFGSDPGLAVVDCIFALNVAESGGAICTALTYVEEEPIALKVSGTSFVGNFADYNGGAIYAGGKVELLDAEVDRGTFFGSNEAGVYGGALAAGGTEDTFAGTEVFVGSNTVFACNKVENDWFGEAMGGAINLPENCALTVRNALFTNNVAHCSGGTVYGVYGGAVCTSTGCTNRFEKTAFVDNRAIADGASGDRYAAGGAVSDLAGVTLVDTCVFDANVVEGEACVGAALDFEFGEETAVVNSTFRRSNVEAVSVYAVAAAVIRNCVIVGNAENEEWYDLYVEETPGYELTFTAYGKLYTAGATEVACSNNFAGCTAEAVYRGETLYLATNEYNKVAALGSPQPGVTDFVGVEYGSTFWGTSMGAFETPAIYPVDQLGFDIYVDPLELAWTGTQVQPSTVVVTNPYTHAELTEGVDYTVGFMDNVNSTDKALVVVTGIGNYAGTATTNYWITSYLVKYYACENSTKGEYDRMLDVVELGSLSGSNVVATIAPPPGYALDPYHVGTLTNGTVTLFDSEAFAEANGRLVLKVFYAPSGDDDVPDKYQRKITYKVANGWWNDAEDGLDRTVWVTLFDADGKWSETGIGKLTDIPLAGEKPFSGYAKAGVWYSDPPTLEMPISHDTPSLPFFLYVYCPQPQGGTGRGGRGSSGSVTQADLDALKSHLVTKLTITDFAYVNGKAAGEARAAVVDELTGQTILDELLRRTKIDILATPSLDKGEWSVIGSPTTDGEGGWVSDERPAAETPAQMFFKLRLR